MQRGVAVLGRLAVVVVVGVVGEVVVVDELPGVAGAPAVERTAAGGGPELTVVVAELPHALSSSAARIAAVPAFIRMR